jgi:predicted ribosome quality control (RQC) complex YloA/Tae2 family protein
VQPVDFTTLVAVRQAFVTQNLPARLEQVYQCDRFTLALALRTLTGRSWLTISWHPQAARLHCGDAPPRSPDTFTFSQQLWHQLGGLALCDVVLVKPWERVLDLQFSQRPGDPVLWHLYVEVQGQYSNAVLVNEQGEIVTAAHQVSAAQSSLRPIQTGDRYQLPPSSTQMMPSLEEPFDRWQERLALIPTVLKKLLVKNYRGLSSALTLELLDQAGLDADRLSDTLSDGEWRSLYATWQYWLKCLETETFSPSRTETGYRLLPHPEFVAGLGNASSSVSIQKILNDYYGGGLSKQQFGQLRHQLQQRLKLLLGKLYTKQLGFQARLGESDRADEIRGQADLLMAHLTDWQVGMTEMVVTDFATGLPTTIQLAPDRSAVQNAQVLYKQHQKFKRSRDAVMPLLTDVLEEIAYLQQVETALMQSEDYRSADDLMLMEDIRDELIQQGYLAGSKYQVEASPDRASSLKSVRQASEKAGAKPGAKPKVKSSIKSGSKANKPAADKADLSSQPRRYQTPSGHEVLIGRNNRQNDFLTFRMAGDYDLWFHTQEIPGSHVLLWLPAGEVPQDGDLKYVADLAAYYSQARQSEQVPVVYTQPKHVYKPKGAKPGMAIYKQETVIWGRPQCAKT